MILAAGKGTRMRSGRAKVLHLLGGKPLLSHCLESAASLKPRQMVVLVGHQAEAVKKQFEKNKIPKIKWATQREQLGTAHAVQCGLKALERKSGFLFILCGDVPLLQPDTLLKMKRLLESDTQTSLVFLVTHMSSPTGYGRIVRDEVGNILRVVEERDATEAERNIGEINAGIYAARLEDIRRPLQKVKKNILKGEFFLTDLVAELVREGKKVLSVTVEDEGEVLGINSRKDLARAETILQKRIREKWFDHGVTLIHPESIHIESTVELAPDVILHPGVILTGKSKIGRGSEVFAYSVVENSLVGEGVRIGPFAHVRPGSVLENGSHVGNFVELKKTRLGAKAKANHLSYLGDADIGDGANIGAGTITCNYDGFDKHRTVIGKGAFIGSDTQLVAPVVVGAGAFVGAGTTVTKNVPPNSLALSRGQQVNIPNWARKKVR